jgi:hypothetical protein
VQYNGSLYLLATDQGFFGQSDLVWQKLDEVCISSLHQHFIHFKWNLLICFVIKNQVNGDGVFLTSNFTPFTAETPRNDSWNQQQAMTTTAVCAT